MYSFAKEYSKEYIIEYMYSFMYSFGCILFILSRETKEYIKEYIIPIKNGRGRYKKQGGICPQSRSFIQSSDLFL